MSTAAHWEKQADLLTKLAEAAFAAGDQVLMAAALRRAAECLQFASDAAPPETAKVRYYGANATSLTPSGAPPITQPMGG
jgi:hypothetical protein